MSLGLDPEKPNGQTYQCPKEEGEIVPAPVDLWHKKCQMKHKEKWNDYKKKKKHLFFFLPSLSLTFVARVFGLWEENKTPAHKGKVFKFQIQRPHSDRESKMSPFCWEVTEANHSSAVSVPASCYLLPWPTALYVGFNGKNGKIRMIMMLWNMEIQWNLQGGFSL